MTGPPPGLETQSGKNGLLSVMAAPQTTHRERAVFGAIQKDLNFAMADHGCGLRIKEYTCMSIFSLVCWVF